MSKKDESCCSGCGSVGRQPNVSISAGSSRQAAVSSQGTAPAPVLLDARTPQPTYQPAKAGRVVYVYITSNDGWTDAVNLVRGRYYATCAQQDVFIRQGNQNVSSIAQQERPQDDLPELQPDIPAGAVYDFTVESDSDSCVAFAKFGGAAATIPIVIRRWDSVDP